MAGKCKKISLCIGSIGRYFCIGYFNGKETDIG